MSRPSSRAPQLTYGDGVRLRFAAWIGHALTAEAQGRLLAGFDDGLARDAAASILSGRPGDMLVQRLVTDAREQAAQDCPSTTAAPNSWDGTVRLERWHTTPNSAVAARRGDHRGDYGMLLVGEIAGHPAFPDGDYVQTSAVTSPEEGHPGRDVETIEGYVVHLGEADPDFVAWMRKNCIPFDPERPIRQVGRGEILARVAERRGVSA